MTTTPYYDKILSEITDQTVRDVYCILRDYVGEDHRITKEAACLVIWGKYNQSTDRTIRECVETLHAVYGVPICTDSGKAGYYMAGNERELLNWAKEHNSRANKEKQAVRKVMQNRAIWFTYHDAPQVFVKPKEHIPASFEAVQMSLIPDTRSPAFVSTYGASA